MKKGKIKYPFDACRKGLLWLWSTPSRDHRR